MARPSHFRQHQPCGPAPSATCPHGEGTPLSAVGHAPSGSLRTSPYHLPVAPTDDPDAGSGASHGTATEAPKKKFDFYTFAVSTFVSLVVAAAGTLTTISTTNATIADDQQARRDELRNAQIEAARDKRETVYQKYLDAANAYSVATNHLLDTCTPPPAATSDVLAKMCPATTYSEFNGARADYQDKLNGVYTFGTSEAVQSARSLSALLPAGLVSLLPQAPIARPNSADFLQRYQTFSTIQCRDVRIDPQQPCI